MGLGSFFKGGAGLGGMLGGGDKGDKEIRRNLFTENQQGLLNQIIGGLSGEGKGIGLGLDYLNDLMQGGEAFDRASAPMMRQFQEQTLPGLSERFAGSDAMQSSAFGQSLGSAGAGLQENLAALRGQQQQMGLQGLLQMLQPALTKQFDLEVEKGGSSGIGSGLGSILGTAAGAYFGGPAGASIGGQLGGKLF